MAAATPHSEIFVFGSNLAGIHGAGSAQHALEKHGAIWGQGIGRQGSSYAIPTKGLSVYTTLPLYQIKVFVCEFLEYAAQHPELIFKVVKIGCGLAGYSDGQIAPMFRDASPNCLLPEGWR
jgi:hypothetical protein